LELAAKVAVGVAAGEDLRVRSAEPLGCFFEQLWELTGF